MAFSKRGSTLKLYLYKVVMLAVITVKLDSMCSKVKKKHQMQISVKVKTLLTALLQISKRSEISIKKYNNTTYLSIHFKQDT